AEPSASMILAVLARSLDQQPTGRGFVAWELVQALRHLRPDINVHLFAARDPRWDGVTFHRMKGQTPIGDLRLMGYEVAREVRRIRADALWCVTHVLPFGLPRDLPIVVTLLDVVWRDHPETMDPLNRWVSRYAECFLKQAERIVCISEFTRH